MSPLQRSRRADGERNLAYLPALIAFIALGLRTAIIGVAWPSIRSTFDLPQSGLGVILIVTGLGTMTAGLLLGRIVGRLGVGRLLILSTGLTAAMVAGLALSPSFSAFLLISFISGLGSGSIDAGINFFATQHFSESGMNRLHGCFGVGALAGPILMGLLIGAGASWRIGYLLVALVMGAMTLVFLSTRDLWEGGSPRAPSLTPVATLPVRAVIAMPIVWVSLILFFCSSGIEVASGQWAFSVIEEGMGQSDNVASLWAGLFWGAMAFGRLTLGPVAVRVGTVRWIQGSVFCAAVGATIYAAAPYPLATVGLMLIGISMSTVFPLVMMLTPRRVGNAALSHTVGFQMSASMVGGSTVPWIAGFLFSRYSYHAVGWVILTATIAFFTVHGLLVLHERRHLATA